MSDLSSPSLYPPQLHDVAPDFQARTTMGVRTLSGYRGRWLIFFSHPADFTPVCTSEFVAFAKLAREFEAAECDLLALSVDSLFAHLAWVHSIREQFGVIIGFPVIEDPSMAIARRYGMIAPHAPDTALVRAVYVIDPQGIIRAILWYPMTIGRNVAELLRLVRALQASDSHHVLMPEGWQPGDAVILPTPQSADAMFDQGGEADWYYRTGRIGRDNPNPPSKTKKNSGS